MYTYFTIFYILQHNKKNAAKNMRLRKILTKEIFRARTQNMNIMNPNHQ